MKNWKNANPIACIISFIAIILAVIILILSMIISSFSILLVAMFGLVVVLFSSNFVRSEKEKKDEDSTNQED